jgi:hypothetical protein
VEPKVAPKVERKPEAPKPVMWFMKSEEGEDYGPIPRSELDAWYDEGRITADCQVLKVGTEQWQWASDLYSELADDEPAAEEEPADEPAAPTFSFTAPREPDESEDEEAEEDDDPEPRPTKKKSSAAKLTRTKQSAAPQHQVRRGAKKVFSPPPEEDDEEDEDDEDLDNEVETSTRSKLTAGLLGIFLGQLGIHRFYLGYVGLGLAMLFTLGGCGIWSLTDAILIFLGKVVDAEGKPLE